MTVQELFNQRFVPEPNSGCWLWLGGQSAGRAVFLNTTAARIAWRLYRGKIPKGLHVLHRCDIPMCVNPEHLFLGTHADNVADMVAKDRYAKRKVRGEDHGNTKLTDREFSEIEQLRGHMLGREIAEAYGVTVAYVSHIQLGRYKR